MLKFYKFLGFFSRILFSSYGSCLRCGRTWNICEFHATDYSDSWGMFPLCEHCWGTLSWEERLPYYRELYFKKWNRNCPDCWYLIEKAVREGK